MNDVELMELPKNARKPHRNSEEPIHVELTRIEQFTQDRSSAVFEHQATVLRARNKFESRWNSRHTQLPEDFALVLELSPLDCPRGGADGSLEQHWRVVPAPAGPDECMEVRSPNLCDGLKLSEHKASEVV